MLKKYCMLLSLIAGSVLSAGQNEIGACFLGIQYLPENNYSCLNYENEIIVNKPGIHFGFLLPVKLTRLNIDYKVKISHHTIKKDHTVYEYEYVVKYLSLDKFSSGLNEILIGPVFDWKKHNFIPQFGAGFIVESLWREREMGTIYSLFFFDLSLQYKYNFGAYALGLIVNFENGFYAGTDPFDALNRLNVSFMISK